MKTKRNHQVTTMQLAQKLLQVTKTKSKSGKLNPYA